MRAKTSLGRPSDLRLLHSILKCSRDAQTFASPSQLRWQAPRSSLGRIGVPFVRHATTRTTKKVKELQQGAIPGDPLHEFKPDEARQSVSLLQGVKNNMAKFDKCVLLTKVGKFYELYFEQAEEYGPLLNLKVAGRRTRKANKESVPMAGFPVYQLDRFLKILVQDLQKYVAISEEFPVDSAGQESSTGPMYERRVARIVTPGTLIDEKFLNPSENNFLLAIYPEGTSRAESAQMPSTTDMHSLQGSIELGLAWVDLSTGDFFTQSTTKALLPSALARIGAREIVLSDEISDPVKDEVQAVMGHEQHLITFHHCTSNFISMSQWKDMLETPVDSSHQESFSMSERQAGHHLLDYVRTRLPGFDMKLLPPRRRHLKEIMTIDRNSMRGLEILQTARDGLGKGSLLHAVNQTVTKSGARLLRDRLASPSASLSEILERLDLVTVLGDSADLREDLTQQLRRSFDVQRIVQKFALNKGDADDMICLARAIKATAAIWDLMQAAQQNDKATASIGFENLAKVSLGRLLARIDMEGPLALGNRIFNTIDEDGLNQMHRLEEDEAANVRAFTKEAVLTDAGQEILEDLPKKIKSSKIKANETKEDEPEIEPPWIMRKDASESIARLHTDLDKLKEEKAQLTKDLTTRLKVSPSSLTLKWTPGLGHICHIKNGTKAMPSLDSLNARMVSSTKSTRSFYLTEWTRLGNRLEQTVLSIGKEEQRTFADLRQQVIKDLVKLRRNAAVMDELDVACSFTTLAQQQSLVRPILNLGTQHKIIRGRHPTVKLGLEEQGRSFISNDLFLGSPQERIWLVTGPNMAGKSTFLRQNALITILAQVGSYVPAEHAEIGLVDQIFSRIGAADDLFRDQSTFMVEMLETATILRQATPRSFVIMDEVGRGTTPEDGTAVGFACLHHLYHRNKCRTLFATHFHALADMTADFEHLTRYCTDVLEDEEGSFSFVHRLRPGVNRKSHALKVARLAGLPEEALSVAKRVVEKLLAEKHDLDVKQATPFNQEEGKPLAAAAG